LWRELWEAEYKRLKPKDEDGNSITFFNWLLKSPFKPQSEGEAESSARKKTLAFMLKVRVCLHMLLFVRHIAMLF
jgi:hypothetical protein